MKKIIVAVGSIFAIMLLLFASLPVNAQVTSIPTLQKTIQSKLIDLKMNSEKQKIEFNLINFLDDLINFILETILDILIFLS